MIRCHNLSLNDHRETLLKPLNLELPDCHTAALYGPTGSGKTALLLIFAGIMKPSSGELEIDGLDVLKEPSLARRRVGLGIIPEFSPLLAKLTLKENLLFSARMLKVRNLKVRVQELLHQLELEPFTQTLAEDLPAFVAFKANLALALVNNPQTLLLDEPEYHLTSEEISKTWDYLNDLKAKGKCIVVSTRYQEVASKCDQTLSIGKAVD